ncbi:hypothetical protein KUTeg_009873 [Tegillarca granosa]|uniref:DEP domain-containing protein n=1 Tax=Tegillarca granosa TaxID=220873 RepID=A0ABQ9F548_TEGGR|nr:hypothetical protein KUTeg_009873 [Tegillarca granosa]
MTSLKLCKLWVHKRNFSDTGDDILINTKEFPDVTPGDIVEIYHPEDEYRVDFILTIVYCFIIDTVSIEQSIAAAFQLRAYKDVYVSKVDPKNVALDLVEILFKDQYYSRSDMWRMRNVLLNTCAYLNKKISAFEMRAQVNELRSKGDRVTCGVITEDTNIVFRSSTAVVQIFIQMSSEMWDFDINGDLYFEKAVNGFLMDLFAKWHEQNCLHDVTIVLFSRTYYDAYYLEDFPHHMRDCLQRDYKGRYYEDFYRVVVQNERYEDWTSTIKKLRKFFNEYPERILKFHQRKGQRMPKPRNSTAAQGNFLETLNMALNLFENYYIDRNFDRTGKVAVVITPGPGVFEVDRELTNITKQRTIDCGVGSDLVCMGEQPLHAAPLFKFHSRSARTTLEVGDDYNIPHWMNHSFYTSKNQIQARLRGSFIPRIKPPPEIFEKKPKSKEREFCTSSYDSDDNNFPFVDYDEYDSQVFKLPAPNFPRDGQKSVSVQCFVATVNFIATCIIRKCLASFREKTFSRESSESSDGEDRFLHRPIVGSAGSPVSHSRNLLHNTKRSRRALINPFAPSRMQFKMTSYRRRWVHAFPRDPRGAAVQTHHVHTHNTRGKNEQYHPTKELVQIPENKEVLQDKKVLMGKIGNMSQKSSRENQKSWLWGPTGEQEWSPDMTTGVDWKSLTIPASLPITTDYFPDKHSLQNDFVVSDYSLVPDDVNSEYHMNPPMDNDEKYYRKTPLSTAHLFQELLSQRLAQGFQLIVKSKPTTPTSQVLGTSPQYSHTSHLVRARPRKDKMVFMKSTILVLEGFFTRLLSQDQKSLLQDGDQGETPSTSATSTPTGEPGTSNPADTALSNKETEMMTTSTPLNKVIEGMMDKTTGLPFLSKQPGLPHNCFISFDAVDWCKHVIHGVKTVSNAVAFMQRLLDDQLICHAEPEKKTYNSLFQNEWCEVSVLAADETETKDAPMFHLHDAPRRRSDVCINPDIDDWRAQSGIAVGGQGWGQQSATLLHKYVTVDVDSNGKSNRPEWGTARYHAYYSPNCAFELQIQWMVATGCILGDLLDKESLYMWIPSVASSCGSICSSTGSRF